MPIMEYLIAVLILSGHVGVPHAFLLCDELVMYGGGPFEIDATFTPATADSRGAIYARSDEQGDPMTLHCHVWKEGYVDWWGTFDASKTHTKFTVQLKKAAK